MTNTPAPASGFYGLGIAPKLLETLDKNKFFTPTPIQHQAIPIALEGKDVVGIAQTGTGKTLAFGIPLIQRLAQTKGRGLVILPTRELALQVEETMQKLGQSIGLRTALLIGGTSMHPQLQALRRNPHVIIATPGRLIDHLDQKTLKLADIRVLVLDEADRMLDMGFAPQINRILTAVPKERQTMLFSATMPPAIMNLARAFLNLPIRIEVAPAGTVAERVTQEFYMVQKEDKIRLLEKLLTEHHGTVLVFSRTKHGAKRMTQQVRGMGYTAAEIHANRSLAQRREALEGFRRGTYRVLIATDIAARGIDVKGIELVINFDLPDQAEDYIHRIGRTGRAGAPGHAISFATPDQRRDVRDIERLMKMVLPESKLPTLPARRAMPAMPQESYAPSRGAHRPSSPYGSSRSPQRHGSSGYGQMSGRRPSQGPTPASSSRYASRGPRYRSGNGK